MRARSRPVRDQFRPDVHRTGPAHATSPVIGHAPPAALSAGWELPVLGADVPTFYTPSAGRKISGMMARFLLDAGVIRPDNFTAHVLTVDGGCDAVLGRWLDAALGQLQCLCLALVLKPSRGSCAPDIEEREDGDPQVPDPAQIRGLCLSWALHTPCWCVVGPTLDDMERRIAGLGRAVWSVIERQSAKCCPLFTPSLALESASYLYWQGMDDERATIEMFRDDGLKEDEMPDIIKRGDFSTAYPPWALDTDGVDPEAIAHNTALLRYQLECEIDPEVRRLLTLTLALSEIRIEHQYLVPSEYEFIGFGAVVCWTEGDLSVRVSDDMAANVWETGGTEVLGEAFFPLDHPASMRAWMEDFLSHLQAIRLIDELLWHLST